MGRSMMFAAGAFGASWLWLLALVVARQYHAWKGYSGWSEIGTDLTRLARSGSWSNTDERIAVVVMLVYAAGLVGFVLRAQFS